MDILLVVFLYFLLYYIFSCYKKLIFQDFLIMFLVLLYQLIIYNRLSIMVWIYHLLVSSMLILVFIVDLNEFWIPDLAVIVILIINLVWGLFRKFYGFNFEISGVLFAILVFCALILFELIYKKTLLGFGDIKLLIVLMINQKIIFFAQLLFLSSILGLVYYIFFYRKKRVIPFGPSIVVAYLILFAFINC